MRNMNVDEQVAMLLQILTQHVKNQVVKFFIYDTKEDY